ncbi:hypothetical protein, partial [Rhizobium sp. BK376]|uniref:hypothetical protein n=1 Tax=Rhizobium sp. BK376 TaxID=2512149 RepID=UPI001A9E40EF
HCRKEIGGRILLRPRLDYSAATVADFSTADLINRIGRQSQFWKQHDGTSIVAAPSSQMQGFRYGEIGGGDLGSGHACPNPQEVVTIEGKELLHVSLTVCSAPEHHGAGASLRRLHNDRSKIET